MVGQRQLQEEVNKIIRFYFDAKEDYRLACNRASEDLKPELTGKIDRREQMHMQLQQALTVLSGEASDNGTVLADFKRDWERVRGGVAGHGFESAIKLADQSDAHAIEHITSLMRHTMTDNMRALLQDHLAELNQSQSRVHEMLAAGPVAH